LWACFAVLKYKSFTTAHIISLLSGISLFGIIIEVLQLTLTDYRAFDWFDVLANTAGVILGLLVFSLSRKLFNL